MYPNLSKTTITHTHHQVKSTHALNIQDLAQKIWYIVDQTATLMLNIVCTIEEVMLEEQMKCQQLDSV